MILGYIYQTTCLLDGRIYIGQRRGNFNANYKGSGKHLKLALAKYGIENFHTHLIKYASTQKELDLLEMNRIQAVRTAIGVDRVFNIAEGGLKGIILRGKNNPSYGKGTFKGRKHSEETKKKMRESRLRMIQSGEIVPIKRTGWKHSPETIKKLSDTRKGKNLAGFTRDHFVAMAKKRGSPWNKGMKIQEKTNV
jgi:group I intron endonuclease